MGVHRLVTGLNGAGKTLYCVATILREASESQFEYRGETRRRRIVQGGINGLLIEHELGRVGTVRPALDAAGRGRSVEEERCPGSGRGSVARVGHLDHRDER